MGRRKLGLFRGRNFVQVFAIACHAAKVTSFTRRLHAKVRSASSATEAHSDAPTIYQHAGVTDRSTAIEGFLGFMGSFNLTKRSLRRKVLLKPA